MAKTQLVAGLEPRLLAAKRLREVLAGAAFSPFTASEIADSRDRALANKLVTTALRRQGHLDIVLKALLDKGLPPRSGTFEAVLRLSLAHLLYLPDLGAHSAVYLGVEAIKRDPKARHLSGLMNAVLRRAQGSAARFWDLPLADLFPDDLRIRWTGQYGPETLERFGEALLAGAPLDLTLGDESADYRDLLGGETVFADTVRLADRDRPVDALPGYREGRFWVQDAAAAVPARLLGLGPGARVLDLCAAPGGKTAQLIKAGYQVTALDNDAHRLDRLGDNLARLGMSAETVLADGTEYRPPAPFDAILLDAPCSATGTFRRHPEVVWHRNDADIAGRVALQRRFITRSADNLKPGGLLIYCVCSLERAEGEDQADWIGMACAELEPLPITPAELGPFAQGLDEAGHLRTHPGLAGPGPGGVDGFFVARYRRRG